MKSIGNKSNCQGEWAVSNDSLKIIFSKKTNGGIKSLVDMKNNRNFIYNDNSPLYKILLFKKGEEIKTLSSLDANELCVENKKEKGNSALILNYKGHKSFDINITCRILIDDSSNLSRWNIEIDNNTDFGIRSILYPIIICPQTLGISEEDDCFLWGFFGGQLIKNLKKNHKQISNPDKLVWWARANQYPGLISVQMQAYFDKLSGLYMATYDNKGCVKTFGLKSMEDCYDFTIEHNYDERPSLDFSLPYETVLGVFEGDWYEAADIYRSWAVEQPWCLKKTVERDDIPDWVKEPRPFMFVISRGNYDRARGYICSPPSEWPIPKHWPAKKIVPRIRKYSSILGTPVVTFMEGWEKIGAPGGPVDIFPPYEGEDSFKKAMFDLNSDGNFPMMYLSWPWCFKRPMVGYDGWEHFKREGKKMAVLNPEGEIDKYLFPNAQKYFAPICVGSKDEHKLYISNLLKLIELGAVALQIDQQLGLMAYPCYSEDHDHPSGYGKWMYEKELEFLREARIEYRKKNKISTFSYEEPCEIWIQELDIHMHRPYSVNMGCIPLFDYLYSEYALRYGGDTLGGYCHPEEELIKHAMIFIYGMQHLVCINQPEYDYDTNPDFPGFELLKNTSYAQRTFAREYMVFGRMLKPVQIDVDYIKVDLYKPVEETDNIEPETHDVPSVMHSVWESQNGKKGYIFINWTGIERKIKFTITGSKGKIFIVNPSGKKILPDGLNNKGNIEIRIAPRSIVLIEQNK